MIFHDNNELINFIDNSTIALGNLNIDLRSDLLEKISDCLYECREIIDNYNEIKFELSRCETLEDFNKLQEEYD